MTIFGKTIEIARMRLLWVVMAASISLGGCASYEPDPSRIQLAVKQRPQGGYPVRFDAAWEAETYQASEESDLGARGILSCQPAPVGESDVLKMNVELDAGDPNKRQGECWWDLEALGLGRIINLRNGRITAQVLAPGSVNSRNERARIAGMQLILESESPDGHRAKAFSHWVDLTKWPDAEVLVFRHELQQLHLAGAWTDADFCDRIVRVGIKLALNNRASGKYHGTVVVTDLRIYPGDASPPIQHRQRPADSETLARLPALNPPPPGSRLLPVAAHLLAAGSSVQSVSVQPDPKNPVGSIWAVQLHFPKYEPNAAGRSARVTYRLREPLDLRQKELVAWAAVGPALRGFAPRPNLVQFELADSRGKVLRGPAANISGSGMLYDSSGVEFASSWVQLEISPAMWPLAAGRGRAEFRADQVRQIGVRFLVGKFSDEFQEQHYPLSGTLLLSDIRIEEDPMPAETLPAMSKPITRPTNPVPISEFKIGINYAWITYGFDAGLYFFGKRDRCGFSSPSARQKLIRDFERFARHGLSQVRVFILSDLRSGVTFDPSGNVSGLDKCVGPDLEALLSAASDTWKEGQTSGISLVPVLVDFYVADGSAPEKRMGARKWKEGEYPNLLTDPAARRSFVDNALRPIIRKLAEAERAKPGLVSMIDVINEPENALAIMRARKFNELRAFVRDVAQMIRAESPALRVTIGSSNYRDLVMYWRDLGVIGQFHYYDSMAEEDGLSLDVSAGRLGFNLPIFVGEVEPSNIGGKLDIIYKNGFQGAWFWSANELDGFRVDLTAVQKWLEEKRGAAGPR